MRWDDRTRRAVSWALVKGLFPSVLLILASLAMWHIWPRDPRIVSWVLLALSFLLFLKGYFRDWRLRWFTILLPGVMAQVSFAIQAMVLKVEPIAGPVGMGLLLAGLILGLLRGLGHNIFTKDGQLFAKPTVLVMLVWLVTYMVTQSAALFGWFNLTRWGLSGSMFSTVVLMTFSIVLFIRFVWRKSKERKNPGSDPVDQAARTLVVFLLAGGLVFAVPDGPVLAQTTSGEQNEDLVYTATFNPEFQECTRVIQLAGMVSLGKVIAAIGNSIRGNSNNEPDPTIAEMESAGFDVEVTGTDTTATYARRLGRVDIGNVDIRSRAKVPNKKTGRIDTVIADFHITFEYGHTGSDGVIGGQTRTNQVTTLSGGKKQSTEVLNKWRVAFSPDGTRGAVYAVLGEDDRMLKVARDMGYASIPPAYLLTLQTPVATAVPPAETSPVPVGDEQFTDSSSDGSAGDGEPDDMLSESDIDAVLDALYSQNLPDAAVAAGLLAGIMMLLAGAGVNLAISVATAIANAAQQGVDDAAQAVAAAAPQAAPQFAPMIDPRDGLELEADGNKVYWDDDEGWIDRDRAQQWISEIDAERAQRDWEVEQNQAAWDAGYDQRMWDMTHRNDDVEDSQGFFNMNIAYDWEDIIDDHVHLLSPEMQEHVRNNLNSIDWSDPYNLTDEDLNKLGTMAIAVVNIKEGQEESRWAAADHRKNDRNETRAYLNLLGVGTRIAATALNPVLGVGVGGLIGYATGREKHREFDGAVTALASVADIWTGGMSPASILWNSTTGGGIAMAEVGVKGGSWDEMKAAGMMAAGMSALFAAGQKPGIRNLLTSVDDSVKSALGINGPRAPQVDAPATGLTGSRIPDADGNTVRFLGQDADGTTALGSRPDIDQPISTGTRTLAMDEPSTGSRGPSMDDSGTVARPPGDLEQTSIRPSSVDDPAMGAPVNSGTRASPNRPSLDQTQTGVRPSVLDDGGARPAVNGDDLMAQFQSETGVKITSIARDPDGNVRVTFDPDDLTDYSVYPGQRDSAEQLLTEKWTNMHAEAEFQSRPPVYDVPGELQTNHGVNNGIRDEHVSWLTDKDAVQKLPDNYDPSTLPQRSLDDLDRDLRDLLDDHNTNVRRVRERVDAEQGGRLSETFPEGEGVWNWPEDGSVPRSEADWDPQVPADVKEAQLLADGWTKDRGGWRSPEVNEIVRQHPELNEIDRTIRRAYSDSGYGRHVDGDHFTKFQAKLGEHVNMNDPSVREQIARWTYYVADRKAGTPPWFRSGS